MGKARKRHVQQEIRWANKRGDLRGTKREAGKGKGKRKRGRPRKPGYGERHKVRPTIKPSQPVHVTLRAVKAVRRLRNAAVYRAVREAMIVILGRESCRIVHLSIQHNHVHLLVEADSRMALARGMQAFQISAAKHINAELSMGRLNGISWYQAKRRGLIPADRERRKGAVFADRYHAEIIKTP
ncbi:MAG: transposase, partial [Burkholderia sp.]|nr:transposase [Burkholderia sp.]